jgi:polyphosphate kinase
VSGPLAGEASATGRFAALAGSGAGSGSGSGRWRVAAPRRYLNRELAWLEFNARVLEEALDPGVPLLERLKFLAIFSSNLDEFFMVRVAGLYRQVDAGIDTPFADGSTPRQALEEISRRLHVLVQRQHGAFREEIAPSLAAHGVRILLPGDLTAHQREFLAGYFRRMILPVVTPLAIDPGHPFPHLTNRTIFLALAMRRVRPDSLPAGELAIVHVPSSVLPRFVRLPSATGTWEFIALEDAIRAHAHELFPGCELLSCNALRVTRDSDIVIEQENAGDLLKRIEEGIRERRKGAAVRLQYDADTPAHIMKLMKDALELAEIDLYPILGHIAFSDLLQIYGDVDLPALKDKPFTPQPVPAFEHEDSLFAAIRRGDVLLHHPYQSFDYVVDFLNEAAHDPHVLAIKMTLYRVGGASPIVEALRQAAENGKQVAVLMELKARFEEQSNITWAKKLAAAGAHVIYGIPGLKTHAKACLVVRREEGGVRRYCHLSTGNYNARTAWIYSDLAVFSCKDDLCAEVSSLFNLITGYCRPPEFRHLAIAPTGLRARVLAILRREAEHARAGRPSRVIAKLNGLEDREVIDALYETGQAGVEVDLIVRGICCLRPGVAGLSERIRVRRIVDRFLEHARILYVENGGAPEIFLLSADWMPRNLDRRIEVLFPVYEPELAREIRNVLALQLEDDVKARAIGPDGENLSLPVPAAEPHRSQEQLLELAGRAARGERPVIALPPPPPRLPTPPVPAPAAAAAPAEPPAAAPAAAPVAG